MNEDLIPEEMDDLIKSPNYILKGDFIILPSKSGLMLVHAKRAMEQILYSRLHKSFISNPIESQKMLFPIVVETTENEKIKWEENKTILNQLGFAGEASSSSITINSVPAILQEEVISKAVDSIIATLMNGEVEKDDIAHELISNISYSGSKTKLNLNQKEEVTSLIDQLFQCESHMHTPGGRKILETITINDLNNLLD